MMKREQILSEVKRHLIRFGIGLVATSFILAVMIGIFSIVAYFSMYVVWAIVIAILVWTIYRTGRSVVNDLYEDKEVWDTIVEDFNELKTWVKSFFQRKKGE